MIRVSFAEESVLDSMCKLTAKTEGEMIAFILGLESGVLMV